MSNCVTKQRSPISFCVSSNHFYPAATYSFTVHENDTTNIILALLKNDKLCDKELSKSEMKLRE